MQITGFCLQNETSVTPASLEQAREIMEQRVRATGLAGPIVRTREPNRLEVVLPDIVPGSAR